MAHRKDAESKTKSCRVSVEAWEIELADGIAASFTNLPETDDLRSELYRKLLKLKGRSLAGMQCWRDFLAKSLWNAAKDYMDSSKVREKWFVSTHTEVGTRESSMTLEDILATPETTNDIKLQFDALWRELDPDLRKLWQIYAEEEGHIGRTAIRLGWHRNTVASWLRSLKRLLKEHGFGG